MTRRNKLLWFETKKPATNKLDFDETSLSKTDCFFPSSRIIFFYLRFLPTDTNVYPMSVN